MLENATRICEAKFGMVFRFDGKSFTLRRRSVRRPHWPNINGRGPCPNHYQAVLDRLRQTKRVSYTADCAAEGIPAPASHARRCSIHGRCPDAEGQ